MADDLEDELDPYPLPAHPDQIARIARPSQPSPIPAVTLRGLGAPGAGSTADLESRGIASHIAPRPIAAPSASDERLSTDQSELQRLNTTGSGISQISKAHPIAGGILRGLNIAGSVAGSLVPGVRPALMAIPGTEEHHNSLIRQQTGRIGEDLGEQKEQGAIGEQAARTEQAESEADKNRATTAAASRPKPKEEKWTLSTMFTDADGTPLNHEENSGQLVRATDGKPPTGIIAAKPAAEKTPIKITRVINGVPHEVLVDEHGNDIKDEGQTKLPGESPQDKRSAQESAQVEREARQNIRKAETQLRATQQSVQQLNSSIDAAKDGNGLLTSFVPTMEVLGINASNGVHRISPAEAQAAGLPGGWAERFNAWFDKASTGKLSPQLQAEGKQLAKILSDSAYQRYKSTYDDESGIVKGYGGKDFGTRVPLIPGEGNGAHPQAPAVGAIEGGYKFKGGDPSQQSSWEKVSK